MIHRKVNIIILLLFLTSSLISQIDSLNSKNKIDSLRLVISHQSDSTKINSLNQLSKMLELKNPKESFTYARKAVELSEEINYKSGLAEGYLNIANYLTVQSEFKEAINNYNTTQ